ncbi:MAG: hypothetical protein AAF206_11000 [Bacteroidota bacterium]
METLVIILVNVFLMYLGIGLLFAILFAFTGVRKIDEGATESGWGFKLLIIPGSIAFWPYLLRKWLQNRHR